MCSPLTSVAMNATTNILSWMTFNLNRKLCKKQLESLTRHEMSSTVCLRLCSDGSSICYSCMTLNYDLWPQNLMHLSPSHNTLLEVWWKSDQYLLRHCVNKPKKFCFQHTLFHRDLDLWPFDPQLWRVHLCPIMLCWRKFDENVSNIVCARYRVN